MKIAEKWFEDGDKLVLQKTHDFTPALESAGELRSNGMTGFSENRHIGRIPLALVGIWLKEAGVKWDDPAAKDVIRKKVMSGDYSNFRVWEGTF